MGMSFEGFDKGGSDKNNNRIYIAIDLKSFYASVECVERGLDPLTTNLVVADESRTEKTICLAVSPSLKAYGISGRARLFEVVQKVKEIKAATGKQVDYIVAKPRMAYYMEYSTKIYNIYHLRIFMSIQWTRFLLMSHPILRLMKKHRENLP